MSAKTQSLKIALTQEEVWHRLRCPFKHVQWRVGSVSVDKGKVQLLAYIDARAVQTRLDDVLGPFGWATTYGAGPGGGIVCALALRMPETGEWVTKEDGADNTDIEAVKGGVSDAFKRAAVNWGIGRYLYSLDTPWPKVTEQRHSSDDIYVSGKLRGYVSQPTLASWAKPEGWPPLSSQEVSDG